MISFQQFIEQLALRIGQHQLPVRAASDVGSLLDSSALHYELAARIVRAIYQNNGCHCLADPVTAQPTFDALGPIHASLLGSTRTDVDVYRFMEELCAAVAWIFGTHRPGTAADGLPQRGALIPLNAARRRLKSLA